MSRSPQAKGMRSPWQTCLQLHSRCPLIPVGALTSSLLGAAAIVILTRCPLMWGADAVSIATSAPFRYVGYANGLVDSANLTLRTTSTFDCIAKCIEKLVCSAVSISHRITPGPDGSPSFECRIAVGDFTWTPNANYLLLMEDIGTPNGYKLAEDRKFYKYVNAPMGTALREARTACIQDGGNLGVPYPQRVRQSILNVIGPVQWDYFIGFTRRDVYFGGSKDAWLLDTGFVLNSSLQQINSNQFWKPLEPSGSGPNVMMTPDGMWNDVDQKATAPSLCVRFNYYTQSPNGKYYKLYNTLKDMAEASAVCSSDGGTLANVYGASNFMGVRGYRMQLVNVLGDFSEPLLFVGGTDAAVEGTWIMPDGSVMNVANKWTDPDQKWTTSALLNSTIAAENCLILMASGFDDISCARRLRFLCEITI